MTDQTPGVFNTQPQPTGPRRWGRPLTLAFFGSVMLLGITWAISHRPYQVQIQNRSLVDRAATPDDVQAAQKRLDELVATSRPPQPPEMPPSPIREARNAGGGTVGTSQADPIAEAKRKREYESLFASNVATPGKAERPALTGQAKPQGEGADPSLEDMKTRLQGVVERLQTSAVAPPAALGPVGGPAAVPAAERAQAGPVRSPDPGADGRATSTPHPAVGRHRVFEGQIFDAIVMNRLTSETDSPVTTMISNPVFAQDGVQVIPAGAKVLGSTKRVQTVGVTRIGIGFHRLILPNGMFYSLDHFVGLNQIGDAGLRGTVNHHWLSTFGAAGAIGLISGLSQAIGRSTGGAGNDTIINLGGGASDATSQAVAQTMQQYTNRPWTVTLPEGTRAKVYIGADLDLPEWRD